MGANGDRVGCSCFSMSKVLCWERGVNGAVGRRVGLLARVQEGLWRMSRVAIQPSDCHRRPFLCWDSDLRVICTIKSRIRI